MDTEIKLRIVEDLLGAELEHLKLYNRLLENSLEEGLSVFLARFRDEELRRVEALHERVGAYRHELHEENP